MYKRLKYAAILTYANLRGKTCVDFFGQTYVIALNTVRRIR